MLACEGDGGVLGVRMIRKFEDFFTSVAEFIIFVEEWGLLINLFLGDLSIFIIAGFVACCAPLGIGCIIADNLSKSIAVAAT